MPIKPQIPVHLIALAVAVYSVVGWLVWSEFERIRAIEIVKAEYYADTVAMLLSEHASDTLEMLDNAIEIGRDRLQPYIVEPELYQILANQILNNYAEMTKYSTGWVAANKSGQLIFDRGHIPPRSMNLFDREYFQHHASNSDSGLVVSAPINAKSDGRRIFTLSRRFDDERGEFAGVFAVGYDLEGLTKFVQTTSEATGASVQLVRKDSGDVGPARYFGSNVEPDDGGVVVRRDVGDFPLTFIVTLDRARVLADWHASRRTAIIMMVAFAVSAGLAALAFAIHFGRRAATMDALQRAHDAAERASAAKSDFLATMSHEIRTPLNGVLGMARLLKQTALDADQRHMLRSVTTSGEQLLGIINDILDTARLESGHLQLTSEPFILGEAVESSIQTVVGAAQEKQLTLDVFIDPDAFAYFFGDSLRLRQIVVNLVSNAIKFTERGGVTAICRVDADADAFKVQIEVIDTGIGIAANELTQVFDKFTQVDHSATRRAGGTGLGLAIVKMLVEQMGGTIDLTSTPDIGSTFKVRLELKAASVVHTERRPDRVTIRGRTALVVDDNSIGREIIQRILERWGLVVTAVPDAAAALEQLSMRPFSYDVLVVDQMMPQMLGTELVAELRRDPKFGDQAVILMSSAVEDIRDAVDPKTVLLHRPVMHDVLAEALRRLFADAEGMPADADEQEAAAAPTSGGDAADGTGVRALIVEDNEINREILRRTLASLDIETEEVDDGLTAVERVRSRSYDVVFMDVQMPGVDGLQATAMIRALPAPASAVPIIALTANAMKGDRERYLEAGMDDYVAKPIDLAALLEALQRQLGGGDVPAAAE